LNGVSVSFVILVVNTALPKEHWDDVAFGASV
jgi:hypothetical protein